MVLDSAGNIGIGTATPGSELDVEGYIQLSAGTAVNEIITDTNLSGASDDELATALAIKTYVDSAADDDQPDNDSEVPDNISINSSGSKDVLVTDGEVRACEGGSCSPSNTGDGWMFAATGVETDGALDVSGFATFSDSATVAGTMGIGTATPKGIFHVGTSSMVFDVGGNVGIGTATPGSKLDVEGNATIGGSITLNAGTSVNEIITDTNLSGASNNELATALAIKTYVDGAADDDQPDDDSEVPDDITINSSGKGVTLSGAGGDVLVDTGYVRACDGGSCGTITHSGDGVLFSDSAIETNGTLRVDGSGTHSVGGTLDPNNVAAFTLTGDITGGNQSINALNTLQANTLENDDDLFITIADSATITGFVGIGTASPKGIFHVGTSSMVFDTAGNVGIGTATPGSKLDVEGNLTVGGSGTHSFSGTIDPTNVAAFTLSGDITGGNNDINNLTNLQVNTISDNDDATLTLDDGVNVTGNLDVDGSGTHTFAGSVQLSAGTSVNEIITDTGLSGASDNELATALAIKTYVDGAADDDQPDNDSEVPDNISINSSGSKDVLVTDGEVRACEGGSCSPSNTGDGWMFAATGVETDGALDVSGFATFSDSATLVGTMGIGTATPKGIFHVGTSSMVFDVGGNVGIGTATPGSKLDVEGNATIGGSITLNAGTSVNEIITDTNLASASDNELATALALKTYIDNNEDDEPDSDSEVPNNITINSSGNRDVEATDGEVVSCSDGCPSMDSAGTDGWMFAEQGIEIDGTLDLDGAGSVEGFMTFSDSATVAGTLGIGTATPKGIFHVGTSSMVFDVGGNVGIGTATPGSKLDVEGNATIGGSITLNAGTSVNEIITDTNLSGASNNELATALAIKTYVDGAADDDQPDDDSEVPDDITINSSGKGVTLSGAGGDVLVDTGYVRACDGGSCGTITHSGDGVLFSDSAIETNGTLRVDGSGTHSVGGTLDPNNVAAFTLTGDITGGNQSINALNTLQANTLENDDDLFITIADSATITGFVGIGTASPKGIFHVGTSSMVFDTAGNVGIGTATPGSKLDVEGNLTVGGSGTHSFSGTIDPTNVAAFTLSGDITGGNNDINNLTNLQVNTISDNDDATLTLDDGVNVTGNLDVDGSGTHTFAGSVQLSAGTSVNEIITDTGLSGASDNELATALAIKTYVDGAADDDQPDNDSEVPDNISINSSGSKDVLVTDGEVRACEGGSCSPSNTGDGWMFAATGVETDGALDVSGFATFSDSATVVGTVGIGTATPKGIFHVGTSSMVFDVGGNVGIGTATPGSKLDVEGNATIGGSITLNAGTSVDEIITDTGLSGASDNELATALAIKTYVDGQADDDQPDNDSEVPDNISINSSSNKDVEVTDGEVVSCTSGCPSMDSAGTDGWMFAEAGIEIDGTFDLDGAGSVEGFMTFSDSATVAGTVGIGTATPKGIFHVGTSSMVFDVGGNVGIGTATPGSKLDVEGNATIGGSITLNAGTSVDEIITDTSLSGASDNELATALAIKTYVDSAADDDQPDNDSEVPDDITINSSGKGVTLSGAGGDVLVDTGYVRACDGGSCGTITHSGDGVLFSDSAIETNGTLRVDGSGTHSVGGTLDPNNVAAFTLTGDITGGNQSINALNTLQANTLENDDDLFITIADSATITGFVGIGTASPKGIFHVGTSSMVFDTAGNVGIGTATPGSKLDVEGNLTVGGSGTHSFSGTIDPTNVAAFTLSGDITGGNNDINNLTNLQVNTISDNDDATLTLDDGVNVTGNLDVDGSGTHTFAGSVQLSAGTSVNEIITDTGLSGASDNELATALAIKTYVDGQADDDQPDNDSEVPDNISINSSSNKDVEVTDGEVVSCTSGCPSMDSAGTDGWMFAEAGIEIDGTFDLDGAGSVEGFMTFSDSATVAGTVGIGTATPKGIFHVGTSSMVFDVGGNVGIGTATPGSKLDVEGNATIGGSITLNAGTSVNEIITDTNLSGASNNELATALAIKTYVDSAADDDQPDNDSEVPDDITINSSGKGVTLSGAGGDVLVDTGYVRACDGGSCGTITHSGDGVLFSDSAIETNGTLRVDGSGTHSVGGTLDPNNVAAFTLSGDITGGNQSINALNTLQANTLENDDDLFITIADSATITGAVGIGTATPKGIFHVGTSSMVFDVGGNVGIATATPGSTLHVEGTLELQTGTSVNEIITDTNLAGASDNELATALAIKTYVDAVAGDDQPDDDSEVPDDITINSTGKPVTLTGAGGDVTVNTGFVRACSGGSCSSITHTGDGVLFSEDAIETNGTVRVDGSGTHTFNGTLDPATVAAFTLSGTITGGDNDIDDINTLEVNTILDVEDSTVTVNDHLSVSGNLTLAGSSRDVVTPDGRFMACNGGSCASQVNSGDGWVFADSGLETAGTLDVDGVGPHAINGTLNVGTLGAFTLGGNIDGSDQAINDLNTLQVNTIEDNEDATVNINDGLTVTGTLDPGNVAAFTLTGDITGGNQSINALNTLQANTLENDDDTYITIADSATITGVVGIGTATPKGIFHVGTSSMVFDTAGIGIGTTSPGSELDVYVNDSDADVQLDVEQDGTGDAAMSFTLTGGQVWSMGVDNDSGDRFKISDSDGLSDNDFVIETGGDVGIGLNNPASKLHVNGTFQVANGTSINEIITDTNLAGASDNELATALAIKSYVDANAGSDTDWTESGGDVYNVNGEIGIGTDNPQTTRFHVYDTSDSGTEHLVSVSSSASPGGRMFNVMGDGQVGIGTTDPDNSRLHIISKHGDHFAVKVTSPNASGNDQNFFTITSTGSVGIGAIPTDNTRLLVGTSGTSSAGVGINNSYPTPGLGVLGDSQFILDSSYAPGVALEVQNTQSSAVTVNQFWSGNGQGILSAGAQPDGTGTGSGVAGVVGYNPNPPQGGHSGGRSIAAGVVGIHDTGGGSTTQEWSVGVFAKGSDQEASPGLEFAFASEEGDNYMQRKLGIGATAWAMLDVRAGDIDGNNTTDYADILFRVSTTTTEGGDSSVDIINATGDGMNEVWWVGDRGGVNPQRAGQIENWGNTTGRASGLGTPGGGVCPGVGTPAQAIGAVVTIARSTTTTNIQFEAHISYTDGGGGAAPMGYCFDVCAVNTGGAAACPCAGGGGAAAASVGYAQDQVVTAGDYGNMSVTRILPFLIGAGWNQSIDLYLCIDDQHGNAAGGVVDEYSLTAREVRTSGL